MLYIKWMMDIPKLMLDLKMRLSASMVAFTKDVVTLLPAYPEWECDDKRKARKPGNKMDAAEPLIAEYNLTDWMDPKYTASKDMDKRCHPVLKENYRGIVRK